MFKQVWQIHSLNLILRIDTFWIRFEPVIRIFWMDRSNLTQNLVRLISYLIAATIFNVMLNNFK